MAPAPIVVSRASVRARANLNNCRHPISRISPWEVVHFWAGVEKTGTGSNTAQKALPLELRISPHWCLSLFFRRPTATPRRGERDRHRGLPSTTSFASKEHGASPLSPLELIPRATSMPALSGRESFVNLLVSIACPQANRRPSSTRLSPDGNRPVITIQVDDLQLPF